MNKIIFGTNSIDTLSIYQYRYPNDDVVLRMELANTNYQTILAFTGYVGLIQLQNEAGETLTEYEANIQQLTVDSRSGGIYNVEALLASPMQEKINELSAALDSLLFDVIPALTGGL